MILANNCFHALRTSAKAAGSFRIHRGVRVLFAAVCLFAYVSQSAAGLKIYYIRHAEGGHNVVKEWAKVPKAQRPAYVGNGNVFTPKGETQVAAATEKLQKYHFDFIAVSSMWRTRHTVMPYLKAAGAQGEVWPELHEFTGGSKILSTNLPPPAGDILNAGPLVELPADETPYFRLREDGRNDFKLPPVKGDELEADSRVVVRRVADMLHKRFGGSDQTILLVGHGNAGKALLRLLTQNNLTDSAPMANTGIWMVEEQPNGQFKLEIYNDVPYQASAQHP
jgi:broad specificity phosphatase PhoE